MQWPACKVSGQPDAHSRLPAPQRRKPGRDTLLTPFRRLPLPITGAQVVRTSVLPVLKVPVLRLSQSLQFPRFSASSVPRLALPPSCRWAGTLSPSDSLGPPPPRPPEAAASSGRREDLSERIPGARTPRRPDPGSYLEAALGLRAPQAGALPTGAHGPCAPAGSPAARGRSRRRARAATRPGCGWRAAGSGRRRRGGGPAGGRRAGGSQGASEGASERARPAPPVTHPRSLPSSSALRSFFPESAAPPTSPAAAFNPCGLGRTGGPRGPAGGEGAGSLTRSPPAPPSLLPGSSAPRAGVLGGAFPRLRDPPLGCKTAPERAESAGGRGTQTLGAWRRGRVLGAIRSVL